MGTRAVGKTHCSLDQVLEVARQQKRLIWFILLEVLLIIPFIARPALNLSPLGILLPLILAIICAYFLYRMCKALEISTPWLIVAMVLLFVPYIGLGPLLYINDMATRFLGANGVRVGLMGAKRNSLDQINV